MRHVVAAAVGLAVGGPWAALLLAGCSFAFDLRRPARPLLAVRPVLVMLLVELRSGSSILFALQKAAAAFPDHRQLVLGARVATVSGLTAAVSSTSGEVRRLLAQLARAQRSGASVTGVIHSMLDADIAAERAKRLARARGLPVRLMLPISLLILPGLVLLLYAPSLLRLLGEMSGPFT